MSYITNEGEPDIPEPYYCHLQRGYFDNHCTTPISFVMHSDSSLERLATFDRPAITNQSSFDRSTTSNQSTSFDRSATFDRSTISDQSRTFSRSTTLDRSITIDHSPIFDRPLTIPQAPTHDQSPTINITLMEPFYQKLFSVDYANVYDSISPTPPPSSPRVPPRKPGHHYSKPNL